MTRCTSPVSVLHVHGDMDDSVPYLGSQGGGNRAAVPSAHDSVRHFATSSSCADRTEMAAQGFDLDTRLSGAETTVETWLGCQRGIGAELWTIVGGDHVPRFAPDWGSRVIDWLLAHPKP